MCNVYVGANGDRSDRECGIAYGRRGNGGARRRRRLAATAVHNGSGDDDQHVPAGQRGAHRLGGDRGRDQELHRGEGSRAGALPHHLLRPSPLLQGRTTGPGLKH
jgi:hypothetical protein